VLRALSPTYAISFVAAQPASAFFALAAVVLAITGAEALYADLGHFGAQTYHPRLVGTDWRLLVDPAVQPLSMPGQPTQVY
jgi:KUP system potassium uptake protein